MLLYVIYVNSAVSKRHVFLMVLDDFPYYLQHGVAVHCSLFSVSGELIFWHFLHLKISVRFFFILEEGNYEELI